MGHAPFVIWTMQRSGGTTFTSLLSFMSNGETTHEPYSGTNAKEHWGEEKAALALGRVVGKAATHNIKHCYELCSNGFNETLFETLHDRGFFFIHLLRRNILAQVESLALARATQAYGAEKASTIYPAILRGELKLPPLDLDWYKKHVRKLLAKQANVSQKLADIGAPSVFFEDIFAGDAGTRRARFEASVQRLNSAGGDFKFTPRYDELKLSYFADRDQKSRSVVDFITNIGDLREMVADEMAVGDSVAQIG